MLLLYNLSLMIIVLLYFLFLFFADVSRKYGNVMANEEPFSSSYGIATRKGHITQQQPYLLPSSRKKIYLPSNSQMRDRLVTIQENVALLYLYVKMLGHLRATKSTHNVSQLLCKRNPIIIIRYTISFIHLGITKKFPICHKKQKTICFTFMM